MEEKNAKVDGSFVDDAMNWFHYYNLCLKEGLVSSQDANYTTDQLKEKYKSWENSKKA